MMTTIAMSHLSHRIHCERRPLDCKLVDCKLVDCKLVDGKLGRFGDVVGISTCSELRSGRGDPFSSEVIAGSVRSSVHRPRCGSQFSVPQGGLLFSLSLGHCIARIAAPLVPTFDLMSAKCHDAATRSLRTIRRRPLPQRKALPPAKPPQPHPRNRNLAIPLKRRVLHPST